MKNVRVTIDTIWNGEDVKIRGKKVVQQTGFELGKLVEKTARFLAPVDSGYLRASITTQCGNGIGTEPGNPAALGGTGKQKGGGFSSWEMTIQAPTDPNEIYVGTPLYYAWHQEFGTIYMAPQTFLRASLELAKGNMLTITKVNAKFYFGEYLKEWDAYLSSRGV